LELNSKSKVRKRLPVTMTGSVSGSTGTANWATEHLSHVNANVDIPMATANEQIRVTDRVKEQLARRRRDGESYNDVLERLLGEHTEADFYDGFGILSDEETEWIREKREEAKEERKDRMRRLAGENA